MIQIYNTMTRRKEAFKEERPGKVGIYVCGPTVYNYIHIGNARTFISFDMIRRYLLWRGYNVSFVQNVTDVDDKIIARAAEEDTEAAELALRYTEAFIEDMHAVGVLDPDIRPKATEEIPAMIALVERLVEQGNAYVADGDVYFSVESFKDYGALSNRRPEDMESGHRDLRGASDAGQQGQLEQRKRKEFDFALWKAAKPGEPSWSSPWGEGRPGWHIECSAMSEKYLGIPFDIHGGGADLVFPHHENERAQSEAACGCTFARYWMHAGMLQVDAEKMSKSLGNFLLLRDALARTDASVLRMLMLQTHYRSPLDFSDERLDAADTALQRIETAVRKLGWLCDTAEGAGVGVKADVEVGSEASSDAGADVASPSFDQVAIEDLMKALRTNFTAGMDDDFNSAEALAAIFRFVGELNILVADKSVAAGDIAILQAAADVLVELMGVLGVELRLTDRETAYPAEVLPLAREIADYNGGKAEEAVEALLACREAARKEKNWNLADAVRKGFFDLGLTIEDTPQGPRVNPGR